MKCVINGVITEMLPKEVEAIQAEHYRQEREYWISVNYSDAVNEEIRKKYSASEEFAILRQRDEKPDEYMAYYAYCEECKDFVKKKKAEANEVNLWQQTLKP